MKTYHKCFPEQMNRQWTQMGICYVIMFYVMCVCRILIKGYLLTYLYKPASTSPSTTSTRRNASGMYQPKVLKIKTPVESDLHVMVRKSRVPFLGAGLPTEAAHCTGEPRPCFVRSTSIITHKARPKVLLLYAGSPSKVCQPLDHSIICRVESEQTAIQLSQRAFVNNVRHHRGLATEGPSSVRRHLFL